MGKFYGGLYEDLSVWVRHAAWLNACPQRPDSTGPRQTRIERLRADRGETFEPERPDAGPAAYLLGYLWQFGPTEVTAGGSAPVSHREIQAWSELSGIELRPWEAHYLRRLSMDYLNELYAAEKPDRPAPWEPEGESLARAMSAAEIRAHMRKLAAL